jgi:agmatine deiminase
LKSDADFDGAMRRIPRSPPMRPAASTPIAAALGFRMPGEFESQSCVWLAWPGATARRWSNEPSLLAECSALAQAVRVYEPVHIVVDPQFLDECTGHLGPRFQKHVLPVDDIWIRDTGPSFLVDGRGTLGAALWNFNTWGDKFDGYERDARLAARIAGLAGAREFIASVITEGGALHVDGKGTVVVTESALLNSNRNPHFSRREVEDGLNASLGTRKVIWLPGGLGGDTITDGHVDGLMTFVKPGAVIVNCSDDITHPRYHEFKENLRSLRLARDACGRTPDILQVAMPRKLPSQSRHFCATYVNCLIVNGAVLIPKFGDDRYDVMARSAFQTAFSTRSIVSLRIDAIAAGGGGIHCITQQQPAPTLQALKD